MADVSTATAGTASIAPPFAEAFATWAKIGLLSFGGPTAQIALMHRVIVEEKKWLDEAHFLNALSFCSSSTRTTSSTRTKPNRSRTNQNTLPLSAASAMEATRAAR